MEQNVKTESHRVIKLPSDKIVCAREYPMTEETSTQLRLARDYFVKQIKEESGEDVTLRFPTTLAFVMADYSRLRNLKG